MRWRSRAKRCRAALKVAQCDVKRRKVGPTSWQIATQLAWKIVKGDTTTDITCSWHAWNHQIWRTHHIEIKVNVIKKSGAKWHNIDIGRHRKNAFENNQRSLNHWFYLLTTCLKTPNMTHTTHWYQQDEMKKLRHVVPAWRKMPQNVPWKLSKTTQITHITLS